MGKPKTEQLIVKANEPFAGMFAVAKKTGRDGFSHQDSFRDPEAVVRWVAERLGVNLRSLTIDQPDDEAPAEVPTNDPSMITFD